MQEREKIIQKMMRNTGNIHILTRAIITQDCTHDEKSFQDPIVLFVYPNRQHDEIIFYPIMLYYSCRKRSFFLVVCYQFFDG